MGWAISKHGVPDYVIQLGIYDEETGEDLATVKGGDAKSNAHLMCAAPDMLAALKELCADKYLSDPINSDRMVNAWAAIAKAEEN